MQKQKADAVITEYLHKIYGFSVKKCYYYEEAEEMCSMIVEAVYSSLLKANEIANIEGYIWRISENTYAKYVSSKKKHEGLPLQDAEMPFWAEYSFDDESVEEIRKLRREIAFLSEKRRRIIYMFYYENKSVSGISKETGLPEGTVKWHLNKARNALKEGYSMERKIGKLGIFPVMSEGMGHCGSVVFGGEPETFLRDRLELNIVYSVYWSPKTKSEIAEELGLTLVFIEDKIDSLEKNGYLVKTSGGRYTTYVVFSPESFSSEAYDNELKLKRKIAEELAENYTPKVREAIKDFKDVYIPGGNREILEAAAIFYGVANKSGITVNKELSAYLIKPVIGGEYFALVELKKENLTPDYRCELDTARYRSCGDMNRWSYKYPSVGSWCADTLLDSRQGGYANNKTADYEYVYEYICGQLPDTVANSEKINRLRERNFLSPENDVNIMVAKISSSEFFDKIPFFGEEIKNKFSGKIIEYAMNEAKNYPPQMQDLIVHRSAELFIGNTVAIMTMDILYGNGTFRPLNEKEKVTANLLMFSDRLPE